MAERLASRKGEGVLNKMNDIVIMEKTGKAEKFLKEEGFRLGDIFELMQKARQDERSKLESEIAELNARWEKLEEGLDTAKEIGFTRIQIKWIRNLMQQLSSGGEVPSNVAKSATSDGLCSDTKRTPKPEQKKGMKK